MRRIGAGLALLALIACGRAVPVPAPTPQVAPWIALPPTNQVIQPELISAPPPVIPPGTPACRGSQLAGTWTDGGAALGHHDNRLILRNTGSSACRLQGYVDIKIFGDDGRLLAQAVGSQDQGTYFVSPPAVAVLLTPGTGEVPPVHAVSYNGEAGQAFMDVEWYQCASTAVRAVQLTLPDSGGVFNVPPQQGDSTGPCVGRTSSPFTYLSRSGLAPSAWNWQPTAHLIPLTVTISAPTTVKRGSALYFTVTIANGDTSDYILKPCPDYEEYLGAKGARTRYQLNCSAAGEVPAGDMKEFAMRLPVPEGLAPGANTLTWSLLDGRVGPRATATTNLQLL